MKETIKVRVPASTANLGSGVDCLGAALKRYLTVVSEPAAETVFRFGDGFLNPISDGKNLILRGYRGVFSHLGKSPEPRSFYVSTEIPVSRGMGSSASAIVAGVFTANAALDSPLSQRECLTLCSKIEGHPDNVVPCALGGITAAAQFDGEVYYRSFLPRRSFKVVLASPDYKLSTERARKVLPERVSLKDAVGALTRASFLTASLILGEYDGLSYATEDLLFSPPRLKLMPGAREALQKAREAGALCAFVSGAGPSVAAFCSEETANPVGLAMGYGFAAASEDASVSVLDLDTDGVKLSFINRV